jgi:outer membrane immunogenic protein
MRPAQVIPPTRHAAKLEKGLLMKKYLVAAALVAALPSVASAQEETAPDGTQAFGVEPYVGILGGYHTFDRGTEFGSVPGETIMNGAIISGVAGVNVPLGPVFVGVEGNATKGFSDIDWEYGVKGRFGARAGESGMIFASAGYQWVNGKGGWPDRKDWMYGLGVEVGPKDIGLGGVTGNSGIRLRFQTETYDFDSFRPTAGVIFHF